MNMYRRLSDHVGTVEARDLAQQLVEWHDSMVKHLRVAGPQRSERCDDGCPHEEAAQLWYEARRTFGARATDLVFLRSHGQAPAAAGRQHREQTRAELQA